MTFPKGFITYPHGVGGIKDDPETQNTYEYGFMTADTKAAIVKWYQDTGPKYGWTVIPTTSITDHGSQIVPALQLENADKTEVMSLDILDTNTLTSVMVYMTKE